MNRVAGGKPMTRARPGGAEYRRPAASDRRVGQRLQEVCQQRIDAVEKALQAALGEDSAGPK
jgi:hypothetical protein